MKATAGRAVSVVVAGLICVGCGSDSAELLVVAPADGDPTVPVLDDAPTDGDSTVPTLDDAPTVPTLDDAPTVPVLDLFEQPVPDAPDPADRAGAAAQFVDCVHGLYDGGWSMDFGPPPSSPDPASALAVFAEYWSLPRDGYELAATDEGRRLFTYEANGAVRLAVIVVDATTMTFDGLDGWVVEVFAGCNAAEFNPSADQYLPSKIWEDADGSRISTDTIRTSTGPEHCGWEDVQFLTIEGAGFGRDPNRAMPSGTFEDDFEGDAVLPTDAVETGYQREGRELWLSIDGSYAYLKDDATIEAWPAVVTPQHCG